MKRILLILLTLLALLLVSCDKTTESDNTPPTVVITYPANNSEFIEGTEIRITAEALDNKKVEKVEFFIDGTMVSTDTTEPYEHVWHSGFRKDVNHTVYAKAFDASNNSSSSELINVIVGETGTVIDIDGNIYSTILLSNQIWIAENLKVTHYRNGDPIPHVTDHEEWINTTSGAYCVYWNNPTNVDIYGNLYNWYAVDDERGLAPTGWHVPTDDDWKELEMFLGMTQTQADSTGYRGINEGIKLAGRGELWYPDVLENDPEFGSSRFTALPGGRHDYTGFYYLGFGAYFWSSNEFNSNRAWNRLLNYIYTKIYRYNVPKMYGYSVRCVRD